VLLVPLHPAGDHGSQDIQDHGDAPGWRR
jgi:hypothetical protein